MSTLYDDGPACQDRDATPRLLLTAREACQALAISDRKLWSLTAGHEIPCVRIGRAVRYDPRDLEAWIEARKGVRS